MSIELFFSESPISNIQSIVEKNDMVVLPTKRALNLFVKKINATKQAPAVITQEAFFDGILNINSKIAADGLIKSFFLRKAIKKTKNREIILKSRSEEIEIITKLNGFLAYLLQFYQELFENRTDFGCLTKESLYSDYEKEVYVLKEIYKIYEKLLNKKNIIDLNTLKNELYISKNIKNRTINIAISGLLSRYETDAIEKLSEKNRINIFINSKVELPAKIAQWLENYGYRTMNEEFSKTAEIYKIKSKIETAAWIIETIYREYYENGTKLEEIVVVLPDESLIEQLRLANRELFNFAGGFSLAESIYLRFIKLLLDAEGNKMPEGFTGIDILRLQNHPFVNIKSVNGYLPVYNKKIGGAFECINRIYESTSITLQRSAAMLLKCLSNIEYTSANYDFLSSKSVLFDEIEKLSLLNRKIINIKDKGENILKIIYDILSSKSYPDAGIGKVSVIGVLESRLLSNNVVIMPSLNENIMPKEIKKELFLNTRIRKSCGLPTYKDRENLQKFYFNNIINNAKRIYLSYMENDTENISKFLADFVFENSLKIKEYSSKMDYIFEKRQKAVLKKPQDGAKRDEEADKKIKEISLSAHSINDFKDCPYRFYLKYIKQIPQEKDYSDESPFEAGNIIHEVMEALYDNGKPINSKRKLKEKFESKFREFTQKNSYYIANPKERLKLEYILYKIEGSDFFERESKIEAEKIETEKKFEIEIENTKIVGRIDRIDYNKGTFEVIDYKTGSVGDIKTIEKPYNTQLPLYAYAVEKESGLKCSSMKYYNFKDMSIVELDFVMKNKKLFEKDIKETIKQIKNIDFFSKNKKSCIYCPYKEICRP